MVHDDYVGLDRLAPGADDVTARDLGTPSAETVVARRGDLRPLRMGIAQVGHLGVVAGLRDARPAFDARQHAVTRAGQALLRAQLLEAVTAEIVRAPLEQ